ncbi:MAG: 5-formyltetrahydrofolate cyclo-ligase [Ectothiorhodospiraceae bacterium]|jgi:5-formyltetrahydrofolate cyclo-ligase
MKSKNEIRRLMRRRRRSLSTRERKRAARRLVDALRHHSLYRGSRHIACYLPADGEMDVRPLLDAACRDGRRVYLPVLVPGRGRSMRFRRYLPGVPLRRNHLGIPEPVGPRATRIEPSRLDLVLTPLVAYDRQGHRLGMGGGFYDTTFRFLRGPEIWRRPRLVGIAFAFQQLDRLPAEPWDVPLWGVATERGMRRFAHGERAEPNKGEPCNTG